jgi:hypothetical protein
MLSPTQLHPKVAASTIAASLTALAELVYTDVTHNIVQPQVDSLLVIMAGLLLGYIVPSGSDNTSPKFTTPVGASDIVPTVTVP